MKDILSSLISQDNSKKTDYEKVLWFVNIMQWVQRPRTSDEKNAKRETVYTVRLKYILGMLNRNPEWKANFVTTITSIFMKASSAGQFSKISFSNRSFIHELTMRLQEKFLPKLALAEDLESLVHETFPDEEESVYIDFIDESVLRELLDLFENQPELVSRLRTDLLSAGYILSVQLLSGLMAIRHELNLSDRDLNKFSEFQLNALLQMHVQNNSVLVQKTVFAMLEHIEKNIETLESSMPTRGVKIELVYLFQMQKRTHRRLQIVLKFLNEDYAIERNLRHFVSQMIQDDSRCFISEKSDFVFKGKSFFIN